MGASKKINCPAPLPEDTADTLLTEMLTSAPYKVPEKTRRRPREPERVPDARWYQTPRPMTLRRTPPMKMRRKMKMLPLQPGETRKGRPPQPGGGGKGSKKGRTLLLDCSTTAAEDEDEWLLRAKPLAKS